MAAAAPTILFGDARRPDAATRVQLEGFEGPLGLLLALIEARQLDVMTVPLGAMTEAYLDALAALDHDRIGNVSTFVGVASQLILIKSRALLPRRADPAASALVDEGDDPEAELRARLILYRAHRDAGTRLAGLAEQRIGLFRREPSAAQMAAVAGARAPDLPPLDAAILPRALAGLVILVPPAPPPPEVVPRTITLSERAAVIRAALRTADVVVLQDLLRGVRERSVVAITFLAMLELMKRREIVVEQAEPWGAILARRTTAEERAAAGVAELGDLAAMPLDESLRSFA